MSNMDGTIPFPDAKAKQKEPEDPANLQPPANKPEDDKAPAPDKTIPFAYIETDLSRWINGLPCGKSMHKFPLKFTTVRGDVKDQAIILEVTGNIASIVNVDYVASHLKRILQNCHFVDRRYNIDYRKCKLVVETWSALHEGLKEMPRSVGFKSTPGLCMFRHDFDPFPITREELESKAPDFSYTLLRISNEVAYLRKLGSLFDPRASRKQIILLYGPSDGGKSHMIETLNAMVSDDYFLPIDPSKIKKDDYVAELLGIRVAVVNEHAVKFIKSEIFKTLTGGEKVPARRLFERPFKFRPSCVCVATMNPEDDDAGETLDDIPTSGPILRRIIPVHVTSIPKHRQLDEETMLLNLQRELPYIVSYCWQEWQKQGRFAYVECDQSALLKVKENKTKPYDDFIDHFVAKARPDQYIIKNHLQKIMIEEGIKQGGEQKRIIEMMVKEHGAVAARPHLPDGKRAHVYYGVLLTTTNPRSYTAKLAAKTEVELAPNQPWPPEL